MIESDRYLCIHIYIYMYVCVCVYVCVSMTLIPDDDDGMGISLLSSVSLVSLVWVTVVAMGVTMISADPVTTQDWPSSLPPLRPGMRLWTRLTARNRRLTLMPRTMSGPQRDAE